MQMAMSHCVTVIVMRMTCRRRSSSLGIVSELSVEGCRVWMMMRMACSSSSSSSSSLGTVSKMSVEPHTTVGKTEGCRGVCRDAQVLAMVVVMLVMDHVLMMVKVLMVVMAAGMESVVAVVIDCVMAMVVIRMKALATVVVVGWVVMVGMTAVLKHSHAQAPAETYTSSGVCRSASSGRRKVQRRQSASSSSRRKRCWHSYILRVRSHSSSNSSSHSHSSSSSSSRSSGSNHSSSISVRSRVISCKMQRPHSRNS